MAENISARALSTRRYECDGAFEVSCYLKADGSPKWQSFHEFFFDGAKDVAALGLSRFVVNFGANDGVNGDPTWPFAKAGYTTLEVEGAARYVKILHQLKNGLKSRGVNLLVYDKFVLPGTLPAILIDHGVPKTLAFLKIDIDSIDCVIANQTLALGFRPAFLQMEFNPEVPPPVRFTPLHHPHANYDHSIGCFSCSLQGEVDVVERYGYKLLSVAFKDAVFVRDDIAAQLSGHGAEFHGLAPMGAFHAARHYHAGKCRKKSAAEYVAIEGGGKRYTLNTCVERDERRTTGPTEVPQPFHLCNNFMKSNKKPVRGCLAWFKDNADDGASDDALRRAQAFGRLRSALTKSCATTQTSMKGNPWGTKADRSEVLSTVPFALDSPNEPGDFASIFGLPS